MRVKLVTRGFQGLQESPNQVQRTTLRNDFSIPAFDASVSPWQIRSSWSLTDLGLFVLLGAMRINLDYSGLLRMPRKSPNWVQRTHT